jgi:hypothetical protein
MAADDTLPTRPDPANRPRTGLAAWEATIGYMASVHSPDVLLTVKAQPGKTDSVWSAGLEWADYAERVDQQPSFHVALRELWLAIEQAHVIFKTEQDALRKPTGYNEFDWVDADTKDALDNLAWVTQVVFQTDWTMIIIYHPTDNPTNRAQVRLVARDGDLHIGGRGASIEEAARKLYRNATPYFSKRKD